MSERLASEARRQWPNIEFSGQRSFIHDFKAPVRQWLHIVSLATIR
jgi:hypothetical protein